MDNSEEMGFKLLRTPFLTAMSCFCGYTPDGEKMEPEERKILFILLKCSYQENVEKEEDMEGYRALPYFDKLIKEDSFDDYHVELVPCLEKLENEESEENYNNVLNKFIELVAEWN
ncbi:MAG: hypothetical protein GY861_12680 [bacterium]|nr:hypothetical protein [bacterium]